VDEYQDTNPLQEKLYFKIAKQLGSKNITVVGDDDQALYRFRGGTVECLIKFPERVHKMLNCEAESLQLRKNYRSTENILNWVNRYVNFHPEMRKEGARARGKKQMLSGEGSSGHPEPIRLILKDSHDKSAEIVAKIIKGMKKRDYIRDYSQIALLFHTTRESKTKNAGPYVRALKKKNIPVYNPRNKLFLEHEEIRLALGGVIRCIHPNLDKKERVMGGKIQDQVEDWYNNFTSLAKKHGGDKLIDFVENKKKKVLRLSSDKNEKLDVSLDELLYQVLSFEPFTSWIESVDSPEKAERLGKLTSLFDSFA